jgi:hypothetical protein
MSNTVRLVADNSNEAVLSVLEMTSNVARDAKKRASDFKTLPEAVFEGIANAYEAYNIGTTPRIWVSTVYNQRKKDWTLTIKDLGVGMCSKVGLKAFFALHQKTTRREGGLNMRGYNGTGKIACFKYGRHLQVETVKDGLLNVVVLTADELDAADVAARAPRISWIVRDRATDAPNGTTITVTQIKKDEFTFTGESMVQIKDKIRIEQLMWMKNAEIYVNDELIPAKLIDFDDKHEEVSPCGNFKVTIYHSAQGYKSELPFVYLSAGRVFVAREQFGKEGSAFSDRIHVDARATEEWAVAHFYDRREEFVSEARDLKFKITHPEAKKFKEFIESVVSRYLADLAAREEERRRASMDDHKARIERELSKVFSSFMPLLGGAGNGLFADADRTKQRETVTPETREATSPAGEQNNERKSRLGVQYDSLPEAIPYKIEGDNKIVVNTEFPTLKTIGGDTSSPLYRLISFETVTNAFAELVANVKLKEKYGETAPQIVEILDERAEIVQSVLSHVSQHLAVAVASVRDHLG